MAAGEGPVGPEEWQFGDMFARPNIARIYDYLLGGKDNFEVDREVAAHLAEVQPLVVAEVRANRAFVRRATAYLAERGIAQFIDLGSGLPIGDRCARSRAAGQPGREGRVRGLCRGRGYADPGRSAQVGGGR